MTQYFAPTPMSKDELLMILEEMHDLVEQDDSFEGFLNYLIPYPPAGDPEEADFMVEARYRIGNTMGQGGMRMIGEWREKDEQTKKQEEG